MSKRYKIEYKNHIMKDFIDVWNIERQYFKPWTIASVDQTMQWDNKNSDIHILVRDLEKDKIIGEIIIIPLTEEQFKKFMNNELKDIDLDVNTIVTYQDNHSYYLLFCAIAIHRDYIKDRHVLIHLLEGLNKKIHSLQERGITFLNMCAEVQTADGKKFVDGFIKLKEKLTTKEGYKLYCFDNSKEMEEWINVLPTYIENYRLRIENI